MPGLNGVLGSDLLPHGVCFAWRPELLWLHVGADLLIALAYFSIPAALAVFASRRTDLRYPWMLWLFVAFIVFCGTTHLLNVWNVWFPNYSVSGVMKLATGIVSAATAILLWALIPRALALPSPAQLEAKNQELEREVAARREKEAELLALKETLERQVEERTEALRRSNENLEQYAYMISHDLQEPLRMVVGFSQLLERRHAAEMSEEAREYLGLTATSANRMSQMLNDLLTLSRVGRAVIPGEPVDLNKALKAATDALGVAILDANATVTARDRLPTVTGSPTLLSQVFQNLIGNALKYRAEARPRVEVAARRDRERWRIEVRDNGIGFDPKFADRVFQPFQRLHPQGDYPGTGMGLTIVKRIVERHGGEVSVETEPGKGTTFVVYLPVEGNAPPA